MKLIKDEKLSLTKDEKLRLTKQEKSSIRVTFRHNCFLATYGENNKAFGKYFSCAEMMNDFASSEIPKADFDPLAHYIFLRGDVFLINQLADNKFMDIYKIQEEELLVEEERALVEA